MTMWAVLVCVGFLSTWAAGSSNLPLVHRLSADPDFRDVTLRWLYDRSAPKLYGFQVNYCELQAWGPYRCRTKLVDDSTGRVLDSKYRRYSVIISGLRMSTNYSFQVLPFEAGGAWDAEKDSNLLIVSTRGFSARAKECLPRASEVEVATGPYFGGRIAVEAADGARCAVDGDPTSPRDTYILHINHEKCGTHVNETTVATFVLVQENLPILTHSTRRFLVVCSFQPETLTVRAGINLPRHRHKEEPTNENRVDVMPYEAESAESVNDVQMSHLQRHQMLVETEMDKLQQEESTMQIVLMLLLAVAFMMGSVFTAWWFIKRRRSGKTASLASEEASSATYENFENSLWENSMAAAEEGTTSIEDTSEDSVCSGVFTITLPPHLVSEDDRPCIVIESNSQSEA